MAKSGITQADIDHVNYLLKSYWDHHDSRNIGDEVGFIAGYLGVSRMVAARRIHAARTGLTTKDVRKNNG